MRNKGFTLIELLIIIAVIGILASSVFLVLNPAAQFAKARDAQRESDLKQIQNALEIYYNDNGAYPVATSDYKISEAAWGDPWVGYMGVLPKDPSSSRSYVYNSTLDGQTYYLYASLENGTGNCGETTCASVPVDASCGVGTCDYGVSSPNVDVALVVMPTAILPTSIPIPIVPTSTPIPVPTSTPIPTPTSMPTSTPTPTRTPTPTPTRTPTPTPTPVISGCSGTASYITPSGAEGCSSVHSSTYPCSAAHDSSTSTGWFSSTTSDPQWIWFDLGSKKCISGVKVYPWDSYSNQIADVQISDNASIWTNVASSWNIVNAATWNEKTFTEIAGRYIRIYLTSTPSYTSVVDFQVQTRSYGVILTSTPTPPAAPNSYSQNFINGVTPGSQCTAWNSWRTSLTGMYSSITIKGSNDSIGKTCTGSQANTICNNIKNNIASSISCGGISWGTGTCGGGLEITTTGSICNCNSGYTVRPCIGNLNWGGVNGPTCSAPSQTMTVICQ